MDVKTTKSVKVIPKQVFAELPQTYTLSPEQHKFYHDNGYLVIKKLIDFASLYSYKQRFIQISKGVVDRGNITVVKEPSLFAKGLKGEDLINKLQDILFDDVFAQYIENPALLHVVCQLVGADTQYNLPPGVKSDLKYGDNIRAMHSMFINKPPGTGRHPPHQDLYYFPFRPAHKIVASWTAVDAVTRDNGCLYVVPGSHHQGLIHAHGNLEDSNKLYHGIISELVVAPVQSRIHLEMSPGDTVFFHPLLVHGSGPNVTKNYRKSISCHYANSECHYVDVAGSVQQHIADEIEAEARRRGFHINFQDSFRYRSKQVMGVKSNL
ncbi:probable phytanoyl-CoA dioxygenase [Pectinophora gossypiella]|nr:probable phytanoyl-CoA dioxygenase [Pectinophora gossypiella]